MEPGAMVETARSYARAEPQQKKGVETAWRKTTDRSVAQAMVESQ